MTADPQETSIRIAVRYAEGLRYYRQGLHPEAERIYREILKVEPHHADSLHLLGVLASDAGRHDEAVELIGRALEHAPDHAVAHHNLGNVLLRLQRTDEAIAAYRQALELEPGCAATHYNLAHALRIREIRRWQYAMEL